MEMKDVRDMRRLSVKTQIELKEIKRKNSLNLLFIFSRTFFLKRYKKQYVKSLSTSYFLFRLLFFIPGLSLFSRKQDTGLMTKYLELKERKKYFKFHNLCFACRRIAFCLQVKMRRSFCLLMHLTSSLFFSSWRKRTNLYSLSHLISIPVHDCCLFIVCLLCHEEITREEEEEEYDEAWSETWFKVNPRHRESQTNSMNRNSRWMKLYLLLIPFFMKQVNRSDQRTIWSLFLKKKERRRGWRRGKEAMIIMMMTVMVI